MEGSQKIYASTQNGALESRKADLVVRIRTMVHNSEILVDSTVNHDHVGLSRLIEEHNGIVDTVIARTLRFDPLKTLPEELWRQIVLDSVSRNMAPYKSLRSYKESPKVISLDLLLSLTLVSKAWSDALLSNPIFWTEVSFLDYYYAENGPARTQLCLHFSRDAPISIHLNRLSSRADILSLILPAKHRVKEIHIHDSIADVWELIDTLSPFPLLTRIEAEYPEEEEEEAVYSRIHAFLQRNPTLESVTGFRIKAINLPPNLRHVETYDSFEAVAKASQDWTHPMEIRFHHRNSTERCLRTNTETSSQESNLLPWKYLTHVSHDFNTNWLSRLPSLVKLKAQIPFEQLGRLASLLPDLSGLNFLSITIAKVETGASLAVPNPLSPNLRTAPSIRTLELREQYAPRYVETAAGHQLSVLFGQMMPSVTILRTNLWSALDTIHWINGSQFLSTQRLSFNWYEPTSTAKKTIILSPSVDTVKIFSESTMPQLLGRAVKSLKTVDQSSAAVFGRATFDLEGCSSLTKLSTKHHAIISWNNVNLPYLQVLKLKARHLAPDESHTRFCCELALSPSNLPSLRKIGFEICPEIDILFIMLERRNLYCTEAVCKIDVLTLPTQCPPFYYQALCDILQGKFAWRPSNYDLSFAGNLDTFWDITLPGCILCHRALKLCSHPVYSSENRAKVTPISYPQKTTEILTTWPDRSRLWKALHPGRVYVCGSFYKRTTVSANSPDMRDILD